MEDRSPRENGLLAAGVFGGGFVLGGIGVHLHSLPLLYLGYGVLGGLGVALGYGKNWRSSSGLVLCTDEFFFVSSGCEESVILFLFLL